MAFHPAPLPARSSAPDISATFQGVAHGTTASETPLRLRCSGKLKRSLLAPHRACEEGGPCQLTAALDFGRVATVVEVKAAPPGQPALPRALVSCLTEWAGTGAAAQGSAAVAAQAHGPAVLWGESACGHDWSAPSQPVEGAESVISREPKPCAALAAQAARLCARRSDRGHVARLLRAPGVGWVGPSVAVARGRGSLLVPLPLVLCVHLLGPSSTHTHTERETPDHPPTVKY